MPGIFLPLAPLQGVNIPPCVTHLFAFAFMVVTHISPSVSGHFFFLPY